ncbi:hypothetical protein OG787_46910 [Streptomyces sp. NBC_00075]|uniref:hypothetical protein n=1 Tax=Streptomyces sp. NBC_00075 TaxID=2975641 RepID=UPI0032439537
MPLAGDDGTVSAAPFSPRVAAGERVLAEWDAVSGSLCDADHRPLDERYGLRQQQREAEMWAQFAPSLTCGPALVAHADATLPLLDPGDRAEGRWPYRLRVLREALEGGAQVHADFDFLAGALVPDRPRAAAAFAKAVAERDADGWHYSLTWTENGGALVEMARAERAVRGWRDRPQHSAQAEAARARSPHAIRQNAPVATLSAAAPPLGVLRHDRPTRSR